MKFFNRGDHVILQYGVTRHNLIGGLWECDAIDLGYAVNVAFCIITIIVVTVAILLFSLYITYLHI